MTSRRLLNLSILLRHGDDGGVSAAVERGRAAIINFFSGVAGMIAFVATLSLAADYCPKRAEGFAFAALMSLLNLSSALSNNIGSLLYEHVFHSRLDAADPGFGRLDRGDLRSRPAAAARRQAAGRAGPLNPRSGRRNCAILTARSFRSGVSTAGAIPLNVGVGVGFGAGAGVGDGALLGVADGLRIAPQAARLVVVAPRRPGARGARRARRRSAPRRSCRRPRRS